MTNHDAKELRAKRSAALHAARMGATYRAFAAACRGERLAGNFYELPLAERLEWEEKARLADSALQAAGVGR